MSRREIEVDLIRNVVAQTDKLTYFGINSVIRSILSAVAFVIDEARYEIEQVRRKLFLLTARGKDLEDLAGSRGVVRRVDPVPAGVVLRVGLRASIAPEEQATIEAGMEVKAAGGVVFTTLAPVTIADGQVDQFVEAVAQTPGTAGNVPAGSITEGTDGDSISEIVASVAGLKEKLRVNNPAPARGGRDEEERDHELRYRAVHTVDLLNQGTETFVEAQLLELQDEIRKLAPGIRIGRVRVLRGIGVTANKVVVHVAHANGNIFTDAERDIIRRKLEDRMPALVQVQVRNLEFVDIEMRVTVVPLPGRQLATVRERIGNNLVAFLDFTRWSFDKRTVGRSDLIRVVDETEGVDRVVTSNFEPLSDVELPPDTLPRLTVLEVESYSGA